MTTVVKSNSDPYLDQHPSPTSSLNMSANCEHNTWYDDMAPAHSDLEFQYDQSEAAEEEVKTGAEHDMESNSISSAIEPEEDWMEGVEVNDDTIFWDERNTQLQHIPCAG